jgi:hypothetical protein
MLFTEKSYNWDHVYHIELPSAHVYFIEPQDEPSLPYRAARGTMFYRIETQEGPCLL